MKLIVKVRELCTRAWVSAYLTLLSLTATTDDADRVTEKVRHVLTRGR